MNIEALERAVARWETYEDRGITPKKGWGSGGDGNSCALGDINFYEKFGAEGFSYPEKHVADALQLPFSDGGWIYNRELDEWEHYSLDNHVGYRPYALFTVVNDCNGVWPIEVAKRFIQWEKAAQDVDSKVVADNVSDDSLDAELPLTAVPVPS